MDNPPSQPSAPATRPADAATTSRRLFLKGTAIAMPAVMSLHSGAVRAATSIGCGVEPPHFPHDRCVIGSFEHDGYMREPVEMCKKLVKATGRKCKTSSNTDDHEYYFKDHYYKDSVGKNVWRYGKGGSVGLEVTGWELNAIRALESGLTSFKDGTTWYTFSGVSMGTFKNGTTKNGVVHCSVYDGGKKKACGARCNTIPDCIVVSATGACLASLLNAGGGYKV
ncbi:MAG: hypothetical protein AB7O21_11945 [Gammaproteobacteria bacterium]